VLRTDTPKVRVIEALDGELITREATGEVLLEDGNAIGDIEKDILKLVVVNRYNKAQVAVSFIKNFGLKNGALASSVAHDSHNIIAVGVSDVLICKAVNSVIDSRGGIAAVDHNEIHVLPLPIGGLMSNADGYEVAAMYKKIDGVAKAYGCTLTSPFMTLSFMALLVIPSLKLSDKGLFDGNRFAFVTPIIK
jgi:adenine deaminase